MKAVGFVEFWGFFGVFFVAQVKQLMQVFKRLCDAENAGGN